MRKRGIRSQHNQSDGTFKTLWCRGRGFIKRVEMKARATIPVYRLTKESYDMKKAAGLIALLILIMELVGCNGNKANIKFPFEIRDVENIEMYHFEGVPVSAEKKVVANEDDIKDLYNFFENILLKEKKIEDIAGGDVTGFRFNLSDGTNYELVYVGNGDNNGKLISSTGNFEYVTSSDIGSYWSRIDLEAVPVEESELPKLTD